MRQNDNEIAGFDRKFVKMSQPKRRISDFKIKNEIEYEI